MVSDFQPCNNVCQIGIQSRCLTMNISCTLAQHNMLSSKHHITELFPVNKAIKSEFHPLMGQLDYEIHRSLEKS